MTTTTTHHELTPGGLGTVPLTVQEHGGGPPFLLLHGGAGPASVAGFADRLAAARQARVIVPTHPGFDGTARPERLSSVGDLARLYAALLERLDATEVTVVGNSLGAWIAAELALLGSPRLGGAVIVDAVGAEVPGEPVTDIAGLAPKALRTLSFHDPERFVPVGPGPTPELVAANLDALWTYGGRSMTDPTLLPRLAAVDLPVHVVWGASDGIVTPAYGRAFAAAIPGARFTVLERAGHLPQAEAPQALLDLL